MVIMKVSWVLSDHLQCQYFVTGVDRKDFDGIDKQQSQLFHVEHGAFTES